VLLDLRLDPRFAWERPAIRAALEY